MNYKLVIILCIVMTLVVCVVDAASAGGSGFSAGFGGIRAREQEKIDPYSRAKYFGFNYVKPVFGYGRKNAPNANTRGNYGRKGSGGVRNKLYASLIPQGRNPRRVSHYDSGYKGSKNLDVSVDLKPVFVVERDKKSVYSNGFARIMSQEYDSAAKSPFSEIHISVVGVPPSNKTETLGAWLVDDNTNYALHLGNFLVNLQGTGSFSYKVYQYFGPYTTLLLTREPLYATDPFPHEPLFVGEIKK